MNTMHQHQRQISLRTLAIIGVLLLVAGVVGVRAFSQREHQLPSSADVTGKTMTDAQLDLEAAGYAVQHESLNRMPILNTDNWVVCRATRPTEHTAYLFVGRKGNCADYRGIVDGGSKAVLSRVAGY